MAILALQAAIVGWLIGGFLGAGLAIVLGAGLAAASGRVSPWQVLRMLGARPIQRWEAPGLHRLAEELSARAGLSQAPRLALIHSMVPNAVTVGSPEAPMIGLTRGLLARLPRREVAAVLAHEMGHIVHGDLGVLALAQAYAQIMSWGGRVGLLLLPIGLILGVPQLAVGGGVLMMGPAAATLLTLAVSRQREFAADGLAAEITGDPRGLASALQRIEGLGQRFAVMYGLGSGQAPDWLRSHPATADRVERLADITRASTR